MLAANWRNKVDYYLRHLLLSKQDVMSRCDLDLWTLDLELLQHFECHVLKLCTKFEQNRIIHRIDDLARLRHEILGVGHDHD